MSVYIETDPEWLELPLAGTNFQGPKPASQLSSTVCAGLDIHNLDMCIVIVFRQISYTGKYCKSCLRSRATETYMTNLMKNAFLYKLSVYNYQSLSSSYQVYHSYKAGPEV